MATAPAFEELRQAILHRVRTVVPDPGDAAAIECDIERDGPRLVIHLSGARVADRVEKAMAVRVLDAIWNAEGIHGQVTVHYHVVKDLVP